MWIDCTYVICACSYVTCVWSYYSFLVYSVDDVLACLISRKCTRLFNFVDAISINAILSQETIAPKCVNVNAFVLTQTYIEYSCFIAELHFFIYPLYTICFDTWYAFTQFVVLNVYLMFVRVSRGLLLHMEFGFT